MGDEEDFRQFAASRQKQLLRSAYLLCEDYSVAQTADAAATAGRLPA